MKKIIISLAIICSGYMASAQLTLVEKVEKKSAAEIVIPFERYTMLPTTWVVPAKK